MARERATKRQQELLQFISDFLGEHHYAPSYREVMGALDYKSVSTVAVHVDALIAKGYLTKSDKSARSIRLASEGTAAENDHIAWLQAEITRRKEGGADAHALETLQKALDILSTNG